MCGIAGLLVRDAGERGPAREAEVRSMLAALAHRGPDGEGVWTNPADEIVLGHRRLAIIDLSPAGAQPMTSRDGRWTIAVNGEVYAYQELRRTLEALGSVFRSASDSEVLLEAIARWGPEDALTRINGMYALAAWDDLEHELWLAWDPAGEKPLYVAEAPAQVAFASELSALRAVTGVGTEIDPDALATYLQLGYVPAPLSIHRGTSKLQPGEWRRYRGTERKGGRTVPRVDDAAIDPSDLLDVLADAVAIRSVADVPVGVFLSGGVDSTIIAALAARVGPTRTFTAAFGAASHDESVHAAAVARALGTNHTTLPVSAADGLAVAQRLPSIYGEPFGDPSAIPTHLIAAEARRSVTVALTGDGGDELFGGYNRLVAGTRLDHVRRRLPRPARAGLASMATRFDPATLDRWTTAVRRRLGRRQIPNLGEKVHKAALVLGARATPAAILSLVAMWADPGLLVDEGRPMALGLGDGAFDEELFDLDRALTLPEQMLTKVDRATMAVALEARPPLLDPRVVALAKQLPVDAHVRDGVGKQVLRALLSQLIDPALVDRPKMGFDPPIGAWLRGPLRAWADELLAPEALQETGIPHVAEVQRRWASHQAGGSSEELRLWTLLQYQLWHRAEHQRAPAPTSTAGPRRRASDIEVRPAETADEEAVVGLLAAAMGSDPADERHRHLLRWKHEDNPFGPSPAWVAVLQGEVVGYRAFLRWRFEGRGRSWAAVRAVDTATHPSHQGRGIFRSLTMHALEALHDEGVDFVFNTPNDQSRPGYLSMGWQEVGRLQPWIAVRSVRTVPRIARARVPAGFWGEPTAAGAAADEALADAAALEDLLRRTAVERGSTHPLRTERSVAYLRWRYGNELLGYRVLTLGHDPRDGLACFRVRRRGSSLEATIGDVLVPGEDRRAARTLVRRVVAESGADYGMLLGHARPPGTAPLPGTGPTLVWRHVRADQLIELADWDLSMGDIELF